METKTKKKEINAVDAMRAKAWETVFIGVVAENMGYANQSNVVKSGKDIFKLLKTMTHKDFRNIKKLTP